MTVFLIAGEASGDIHAAALVSQLRERHPEARFAGLGGDAMRDKGVKLYQDYRQMAYMGIVSVIRHAGAIRRNFRIAQEALLREQPDALILIDYPSFNLRMAAFCRKHLPATRIIYYIPPKVWAWKKWRVHKIARLCDEVLGIFPFEPAFYQQFGYQCTYVGNPCVCEVGPPPPADAPRSGIALLPGSRESEIRHCLPTMIRAAEAALQQAGIEATITIAGAPGIAPELYASLANGYPVRFGAAHELLRTSMAAIVNSGTATLEAALLDCPQVPVYHIACPWIAHLRPLLFPSPYFTLPNILLQREVVREKIAYKFTVKEVASELLSLLTPYPSGAVSATPKPIDASAEQMANKIFAEKGLSVREIQLRDYAEIRQLLGSLSAPAEAAKHCL